MTLSAVGRTPVEIWRLIFLHAIASPLLPFTEHGKLSTDLIDNLQTFSASCRHYRTYRDVTQATIERLRLVCRAWAELLRDSASECVLTDLSSNHHKSEQRNQLAKRVHVWSGECCDCDSDSEIMECDFAQDYGTINWTKDSSDDEFLYSRFPSVEVLIVDPLPISSLRCLKPLSRLVALSLHGGTWVDAKWSMEDLSLYTPRLTHLDISYLHEKSKLLFEKVTHPSIHFLSLHMDPRHPQAPPGKIMDWTFPALETLHIRGYFWLEHETFVEGFLLRHIGCLKGLDIAYRVHDTICYTRGHIPSNLWDICPGLTKFGIDSHYISEKIELLERERSLNESSPIEILLHRAFDQYMYGYWLSELAIILQDLVSKWKISRVIFAEPWDEVFKNVASKPKAFFESFGRDDVPLVDHFNVHIQSIIDA
ncbi:hypothetical protein CPB86DRAFT_875320 [Serendipita vermifera]|nr:hypothetical protein CPB86DRAFT_875320 [Serendipita vermifera]